MNAFLVGNFIEIEFRYDPARVALVKTLTGRKYRVENGRHFWTVPASEQAALEIIEKLEPAGWDISESIRRLAKRYDAKIKLDQKRVTKIWDKRLRKYQNAAVSFMEKLEGRVIIGDDVGLGKRLSFLRGFASKRIRAESWSLLLLTSPTNGSTSLLFGHQTLASQS